MGASESRLQSRQKVPQSRPQHHPIGPVFQLKKHHAAEPPVGVMLRSYRTKQEKRLALAFLERIHATQRVACKELIHALTFELYVNADYNRDRMDRELILATNAEGPPKDIAGYAFIVYRRRGVYIQLLEACFKKRGIGSILVKYCIQKSRDAGAQYINLVSLNKPGTLQFYEHHGFVRGPYGSGSQIKPTQWKIVNYSNNDDNEKKEKLPKLHLQL